MNENCINVDKSMIKIQLGNGINSFVFYVRVQLRGNLLTFGGTGLWVNEIACKVEAIQLRN